MRETNGIYERCGELSFKKVSRVSRSPVIPGRLLDQAAFLEEQLDIGAADLFHNDLEKLFFLE